jgi:DHA2 family multidrug resistance protein
VIFGLLVLSFGMFQLAYINLTTSFRTFVYLWMISRGGLGFLFVPINVVAFSFVSKERMNSATGLINLARNIGGSVGISLVTTIQVRLTQKHQNDLVSHMTPLNPRYLAALHGLTAELQQKGSDAVSAAHQATTILYGELQRQASMLAFIDVFWLLGVVCLAMIPFMFLIKTGHHHDAEHIPVH